VSAVVQARKAREQFALTTAIVLEDVADGKRTALDAISTLERALRTAAMRFMQHRDFAPHGHRVWNEHGPLPDLLAIREAHAGGDHSWNALLERVRKAREERLAHVR
jgi:hypothetical protein